jgi:hypothetical protein
MKQAANSGRFKRFQLVRSFPATDAGPPLKLVVDFLLPRHDIIKNRPALLPDFAAQK